MKKLMVRSEFLLMKQTQKEQVDYIVDELADIIEASQKYVAFV